MENNKDLKTAFPTLFYNNQSGQPCGYDSGMTLRDYFANSAMQGLLASGMVTKMSPEDIKEDVKTFYDYADAMLKQREL